MSEAEAVHSRELLAMCIEHFNEPVLISSEVHRLIGYGETGVDCYLITRKLRGEIIWCTCVGGYIFLDCLKHQGVVTAWNGEEWNDYTRLDSLLALNGSPSEDHFRIELRHDDMETSSKAPS